MLEAAVGCGARSCPGGAEWSLVPSLGRGEEGLANVELAECYPGALETIHVKKVVFTIPWLSRRKIGVNVNTKHCFPLWH